MTPILYSRILGDHPQHLIIVHGLFGQSDNWNSLGKRYAEHFTTHLVDLRNHGSSFHQANSNHDQMAEDFVQYLQFHNIPNADFIGHSLGGKVMMTLALNHPTVVQKLVVADMAPKTYPPHHQGIIKGLQSVDFQQVKSRSDVEPFMAPYIPEPGVRQFLLKNVYRKPDGTYDFRFNLPELSSNYNNLITNNLPEKQFTGPTLFLAGERSDYITPQDQDSIHHYFPNAQIKTISKAGHWLHAENPDEFFQKTMDFLVD